MGEGNKQALQARPAVATSFHYRDDGFLPEGMVNYLALLGWSIADDRDIFSPGRDWSPRSTSAQVTRNPARFDPKKAEAINGAHIRAC